MANRLIEIVGGGLAGLALGVSLRKRGVATRIFETGTYPRHRVCGEFVCGVSAEVLEDLGVAEIYADALQHLEMRWWMGDDLILKRDLPQVALSLSRHAVDERLARAFVDLGGDLRTGKKVSRDEDANGRVWAVGKKKSAGARWLGLKIHVRGGEFSEGLEMHSGRGGYLGVCGVEDGRHNLCGLFQLDKSVKGQGAALILAYLEKAGLATFAEKFTALMASGQVDEESFCAVAGFELGAQKAEERFCVGDATLLIPPFSGNGMSMALESAWLAAPILEKYARAEIAWSQALAQNEEAARRFFAKRMKLAGLIHPALFSPLGRTGLRLGAKCGLLPFQTMFRQLRTS